MAQLKQGGVQGKQIVPLRKYYGMQDKQTESEEHSKQGYVHEWQVLSVPDTTKKSPGAHSEH